MGEGVQLRVKVYICGSRCTFVGEGVQLRMKVYNCG